MTVSIENGTTGHFTADVAVVGGGGTGLAAAVAAAEKGCSVILLEKRKNLGGTSAMAGGIFAAGSTLQKRLMIDASTDELFKLAMEYTHWRADPRMMRAFINKSGDTIRWLEEKGVKVTWIPALYPNQHLRTLHWIEREQGTKIGGRGYTLVKALEDKCNELGVQILTDSVAKTLNVDGSGRVIGLFADMKEQAIEVTANSVVIGTGGYGGNAELLKKYCAFYDESMFCDGAPNMGDGLRMVTEAGAGTDGLGVCMFVAPFVRSPLLAGIVTEPTLLSINKNGERFCDENILCQFERGNPLSRQPECMCYVLFDEFVKQNLLAEGLKRPGWTINRKEIHLQPEIDSAALERSLRENEPRGLTKSAGTLDEIADWMGMERFTLRSTVEQYNAACDRGYDELFAKDRKYLLPLRTAPYYAVKCGIGFHGTVGGIRANHRMEVMTKRGNSIGGLYAGGTDIGGWIGDTYVGRDLPGIALGFAINSGRIAGENAADYARAKGAIGTQRGGGGPDSVAKAV